MPKNVIAIGAHFDDIELGCGGTVARHAAEGDQVFMLVVTDSAYYNYDGTPVRSVDQAYAEGRTAAKILGADELLTLDFETKNVHYGFHLIEKINEIIDNYNIDIAYTHWDKDVHQDHSAIGKATLNAGRHTKSILMYRSNWYRTTSEFRGNYYVDISEYMETKIASVKAHESEYERRGDDWIDFFVKENANSGREMSVQYAECFEIVKLMR